MSKTTIDKVPNIIDFQNDIAAIKKVQVAPVQNIQPVNPYYQDTIGKAGEDQEIMARKRNSVDYHYETLSKSIEDELNKIDVEFEKLQALVQKIVCLMMRRAAKDDQEYIQKMNIEIKKLGEQIQRTYNSWTGITVSVLSAAVSIGGGAAGLAPLAPAKLILPATASMLHGASQAIGTAGTGIGAISSILNNRQEGERTVLQLDLKRTESKEEDRKGAKHHNKEVAKKALDRLEESNRLSHDTISKMAG